VYTTPISAPVSNKEFLYSEIDRAVLIWNGALKSSGINLLLNTINTPVNADIIIHWVKVGRVYEGMCKYPSVINGVLKKVYDSEITNGTIVIPENVTSIGTNAFAKEVAWSKFNLLTKITNKTGKAFNWKSITNSALANDSFEVGTIKHQLKDISVVK
jgi:hypothetical protein